MTRDERMAQLVQMSEHQKKELLKLYRYNTGEKPLPTLSLRQVAQVIVEREFERKALYGATG